MFCVQFILLTAYSGCANLLVLIARCVIIMLKPDHKWARWNGWLTYDLIVGAYAGVLNETIAATSIIVSIIRFGWKSLGENEFKTHGTEAARKLTGTSLRGEE